MTDDERKELEELRNYKSAHSGKALNRAFARLEQMLETMSYDPMMPVRPVRIFAECLLTMREELRI